jgi:transcriptional regulator with XRE-family HTH domain
VAFSERLKAAREKAGLSQEAVARRARIGLKSYGDLERGRATDPHTSSVIRIAHALDVPVGQLLEEEPAGPLVPRTGLNFSACRRFLDARADKWEPVLQEATRRGRVDQAVYEEFKESVDRLTPLIDVLVQVEMRELGPRYDEEGIPIFWSEYSELAPATARLTGISLGFSRLTGKSSALEVAAERWGMTGTEG